MRDIEPFRLLLFLGIIVIGLMIKVPAAVSAKIPKALYTAGKRHYESGRYLAAAERLFAFLQLAGDGIDRSTRQSVLQALDYSEDQVQISVETRRQLDAAGQVVEVVVATGDPQEQGGPITRRKPFHSPPPRIRFKPELPRSVKIPIPQAPPAAVDRADRPEAVASGANEQCVALEKRIALLLEENERMFKRATCIEMKYIRLEQNYKALTGDEIFFMPGGLSSAYRKGDPNNE